MKQFFNDTPANIVKPKNWWNNKTRW
jgi:hypothetical protein